MTFSICVREPYERAGETHHRFGVAVTTRLPVVGAMCPFANAHGAVATQSHVNPELGRRGVAYLADGLGIDGALSALLDADEGRAERQVHGVDADDEFAASGEECKPWYGDATGEGYSVAGNLLTGEAVLDATASAYEDARRTGEPDGSVSFEAGDAPLATRLRECLEAGHDAGGDKRDHLTVQSAAIRVATSEGGTVPEVPLYNDVRVDATETPIADLAAAIDRIVDVHESALADEES